MYQLICEGECNPDIARVDQMASRFMDDMRQERPTDGEALFLRQRALVYTEHDCEGNRATCMVCSHERGFGDRLRRLWMPA